MTNSANCNSKVATKFNQKTLHKTNIDKSQEITHCQEMSQLKFKQYDRRRLIYVFLMLTLMIYVPRIPRLETYLLVAYKQPISLGPEGKRWRNIIEMYLSSIEKDIKFPAFAVDKLSRWLTLGINTRLESIYCPSPLINAYVKDRLNHKILGNKSLEKHCIHSISRAFDKEISLIGLTSDGRIILSPSDIVLLAGDSLMQGPAPQIASELKIRGVRAVDASQVSTGLAYPQFFDWPAHIRKSIIRDNVSTVVVFLGANDTFDMYQGEHLIPINSSRWDHLYESRIESISAFAKAHKVRLLWLGMPAMNRNDIQPNVPRMNALYKNAVERNGGLYLRTDNVLGESEYHFTSYKSVDGRKTLVRSDDGVHFTPNGWNLIANSVLNRFVFR